MISLFDRIKRQRKYYYWPLNSKEYILELPQISQRINILTHNKPDQQDPWLSINLITLQIKNNKCQIVYSAAYKILYILPQPILINLMDNNNQNGGKWLMCLPCEFQEKEKNDEINITKNQRKKYARPLPFRKNQHNKSIEMQIKYPTNEGTQQKSIYKIKNLGNDGKKNSESEKDETSRGSTKPNKLSIKKKKEVKRANQIQNFENLLNCQYSDYQYR